MWTKDGGDLPDLDRMIVEGRELTFTSLNKTDNGTYRCEASNHLGTSSAEYVLYVYGEFGENTAMWVIMFLHHLQRNREISSAVTHLTPLTDEGQVNGTKLQEDTLDSSNVIYG